MNMCRICVIISLHSVLPRNGVFYQQFYPEMVPFPLLFVFVLFLEHAFLREARQEGPLVPPTLPWQVELPEGPPPAPPLLRRRPHNKTHFPLHRLS